MTGCGSRTAGGGGRSGEQGHLMAGLLAIIAIMMIFSMTAFQAWEDELRRDDEAEMIFRAQELVRAIQRYRQDNGGLPPEKLEDLMEPGPRGNYYLRRLYEDPLVKDGKWGLLYAGPGGTVIDPNAPPEQQGAEGAGGLGSGGLSGLGQPGAGGLQGLGQPAAPGTRAGAPSPGQPGGLNPGASSAFGGPGQSQAAAGQQLAGLRVAGVKSLCADEPFRVYKGFTEYSQWLFTFYDLELQQVPGAGRARPGMPGAGRPGPPGVGRPGMPGAGRPGAGKPGAPGGPGSFRPFGGGQRRRR